MRSCYMPMINNKEPLLMLYEKSTLTYGCHFNSVHIM